MGNEIRERVGQSGDRLAVTKNRFMSIKRRKWKFLRCLSSLSIVARRTLSACMCFDWIITEEWSFRCAARRTMRPHRPANEREDIAALSFFSLRILITRTKVSIDELIEIVLNSGRSLYCRLTFRVTRGPPSPWSNLRQKVRTASLISFTNSCTSQVEIQLECDFARVRRIAMATIN